LKFSVTISVGVEMGPSTSPIPSCPSALFPQQ
jgi:hypothetical protein